MLSNTQHRIYLYFIITVILQYMAFDVAFVKNVFSCKNFIVSSYLYSAIYLSITLLTSAIINHNVKQIKNIILTLVMP